MHPFVKSLSLFTAVSILTAASTAVAASATIPGSYGRLPLTFEKNEGQSAEPVRFLSRGKGYAVFLTPQEAVLRLGSPHHQTSVVRWQMAGGNHNPLLTGESPLLTTSNYLRGNDPGRWHTGVANFSSVRYANVYPGIDLIYHGNGRQLEYDFTIAPHSDPARIRLAFHGAQEITIGSNGELILHTPHGNLIQPRPQTYQEAGGQRQPVESGYQLFPASGSEGAVEVGFAVAPYDPARPLIIDPTLSYATFLGGSALDEGGAIAVDSDGSVYVAGVTASPDFPGVSGTSAQPSIGGDFDAFVTKINPAGTAIVYSTFLGDAGTDYAQSIAVDSGHNAYLTGATSSASFPGVSATSIQSSNGGGWRDAFVTKINAAGTAIVYSTFLGGSGDDVGDSIAVDGAGNAYVAGETTSSTFPGVGPASIQSANAGDYDGFVVKLTPDGTAITYATFLGGAGEDGIGGIAIDGAGNAYVTGWTASASFPGAGPSSIQPSHAGGAHDAFVTKIDAAGASISYSTFLGGSGDDAGAGIAVDRLGNVYIAGNTDSASFPGVSGSSIQSSNAGGGDVYVTKIDPTGTSILY